jgi:hypothetical protein
MRRFAVLVLAPILVLAACSTRVASPSAGAPATSRATPDQGASILPTTTPPTESLVAARACAAGEVAIGTVAWTGATAEMGGGFTLVDVGPNACQVGGRPTSVAILGPGGRPLALNVEPFEPDLDPGLMLLLPETGAVPSEALYPGQTGVQLFWTNWCGAWSRFGTLVVSMPGLGVLRAPIVDLSAPRCDASGQPSVLQVGPVITPR